VDEKFDYVICGGGSAGCVLASRLSENGRHRVALVEAGPDTPPGREPAAIRSSYHGWSVYNPEFLWTGLKVRLPATPHNRPDALPPLRSYEQARVLGGGSSINGQLANRGLPNDYDHWVLRGASGWGWHDVLPYFRKLEHDQDFAGELHGNSGAIPVRRVPQAKWSGHAHAAAAAWAQSGLPLLPDQNGMFEDGHFPIAISNAPADHRVSAAMGYLTQAVRARPNLAIFTDMQAGALVFDGRRVTGVQVSGPEGARTLLAARDVIVSQGAIHSPAYLLRNGIGPEAELRALGITVQAHLPGVGKHLMEHPTICVAAYLKRGARLDLPREMGRNIFVGARYSSGLSGVPGGDMFVLAVSRPSWHAVGHRLGSLNAWVNMSHSTAGNVRLRTPHAQDEPEVRLELLSDRRDLDRLTDAVRRLVAWHSLPPLAAVALDPFLANYTERVRKVSAPTTRNRILTGILGRFMDVSGATRRLAIGTAIAPGPSLAELIADEEALAARVRESVTGQWHATCTCRMGADDDSGAVTDTSGRVRGVGGLRVCDASIMPWVPSANTNIPTLMLAEKISAQIMSEA
jgi:5-(hydroxymethyl)furfural/furfural oxidase